MKNIPHIIALLITENNCVVIPGFGGFVGTYQAATLDIHQNTIKAPHKVLIFNQNLTLNDGLLTQSISKHFNCSFSEALLLVEEFVSDLKNNLNLNQRIEIDNIGFLFLDEEKQIKFVQNQQYNFLKSSFGLSGLKLNPLTPIHNETASSIKTEEPVFVDRRNSSKPIEEQKVKAKTKLKVNYKWLSIGLIIPIIGSLIWFSFKNNFKDKYKQQAGINPLQDLYVPIDYNYGQSNTPTAPAIGDSTGLYELKITDLPNVKPILVRVKNEADSTRVEQPEIKKVSEASFGIIAGCFSNLENANNFTNQLKTEGYNAVNVGIGANGLHRVVFSKYNSKPEAYAALAQIKAKYPNAWISQLK